MGGGGGGPVWPEGVTPGELLKRASSEEQRASYQAELNSYLQDLLYDFNNRDAEQINAHLETIEDALNKENIGSVKLVYGGSIKKHTYVDGLSDVDMLAMVDRSELVDKPPRDVLLYFAARLRERLPDTEMKIGTMAVTVRFKDGHEIQVLPAISTPTGVRIPNADGTNWSGVVKPDKFAGKLTSVNQSNSGRVVPVIKLYKSINARLPSDVKLSGYHIESLAINAFENYKANLTYKDMLQHFTEYASQAVLRPIADSTNQSVHVDDYLGEAESFERQKASAVLARIAARMRSAESENSVDKWKELMGD
jgi:hypothetical protein